MAQLTSYIYDDCYVCEEAKQNDMAAQYVFNSMPYERSSQCVEIGGTAGGSTGNSSTATDQKTVIDIESALRGISHPDGDCEYYNRDSVNTDLSKFENSITDPPFCDTNTEPIHTRQGCRPDYMYSRIFEMNIPSMHPWQKSIPQSINTQELSRDTFNELNPTEKCVCTGPVPHKQ